MDPRNAAKVTSPDLLKAFHSDTQGLGAPQEETSLRIWVVLFTENEVASQHDFRPADMEQALELVREHLVLGENRGVALVVSSLAPQLYLDAADDISQKG